MCGIIGIINNGLASEDIIKYIRNMYANQKSRGDDSFGIAVMNGNKIIRNRCLFMERLFTKRIKDAIKADSKVIFHHRARTSTVNLKEFAHPFMNETKDLAIVHNGVIWKYMDLFKALKLKGHIFESEHVLKKQIYFVPGGRALERTSVSNINDSEVALHLLEEGEKYVFSKCGGFAILGLDAKTQEMIVMRDSNPLKICRRKGCIFISSEEFFKRGSIDIKSGCVIRFKNTKDFTMNVIQEESTNRVLTAYSGFSAGDISPSIRFSNSKFEDNINEKIIDDINTVATLEMFLSKQEKILLEERIDELVAQRKDCGTCLDRNDIKLEILEMFWNPRCCRIENEALREYLLRKSIDWYN